MSKIPSKKVFMTPICSYGRAENLFFQSANSLTERELALDEILKLVEGHEEVLFPSHLLDRPDLTLLLSKIKEKVSTPRVLLALGQEFSDLKHVFPQLLAQGWKVDLLVDRPLSSHLPLELSQFSSLNIYICPLHFFDPLEIADSILKRQIKAQVHLTFFEPRERVSLLCNADEIMYWKEKFYQNQNFLDQIPFVVFELPQRSKNSYYTEMTQEAYQQQFLSLGGFKILRFAAYCFSLIILSLALLKKTFLFIFGVTLFRKLKVKHRSKVIILFILWPLRKIYWILEHELHKRFLNKSNL